MIKYLRDQTTAARGMTRTSSNVMGRNVKKDVDGGMFIHRLTCGNSAWQIFRKYCLKSTGEDGRGEMLLHAGLYVVKLFRAFYLSVACD